MIREAIPLPGISGRFALTRCHEKRQLVRRRSLNFEIACRTRKQRAADRWPRNIRGLISTARKNPADRASERLRALWFGGQSDTRARKEERISEGRAGRRGGAAITTRVSGRRFAAIAQPSGTLSPCRVIYQGKQDITDHVSPPIVHSYCPLVRPQLEHASEISSPSRVTSDRKSSPGVSPICKSRNGTRNGFACFKATLSGITSNTRGFSFSLQVDKRDYEKSGKRQLLRCDH